jgi:hypothetical protein
MVQGSVQELTDRYGTPVHVHSSYIVKNILTNVYVYDTYR